MARRRVRRKKEIELLRKEIEKLKAENEKLKQSNIEEVIQGVVEHVKKSVERGKSTDQIVREVTDIIMSATSNPEFARDIGLKSGVNMSVIANEVRRLVEGKMSTDEVVCFGLNVANVIGGAILGDSRFREIEREISAAKSRAINRVVGELE